MADGWSTRPSLPGQQVDVRRSRRRLADRRTAGKWQISPDDGDQPVWRGKQIYYLSPGGSVMAVAVEASGSEIRVAGRPTRLFDVPPGLEPVRRHSRRPSVSRRTACGWRLGRAGDRDRQLAQAASEVALVTALARRRRRWLGITEQSSHQLSGIKKARRFRIGPWTIIPAVTYSPTHLRMQYHRR